VSGNAEFHNPAARFALGRDAIAAAEVAYRLPSGPKASPVGENTDAPMLAAIGSSTEDEMNVDNTPVARLYSRMSPGSLRLPTGDCGDITLIADV